MAVVHGRTRGGRCDGIKGAGVVVRQSCSGSVCHVNQTNHVVLGINYKGGNLAAHMGQQLLS